MIRVAARFHSRMRALVRDRAGISTTELGILLAMVVLASVPAFSLLGDENADSLDRSSAELAKDRELRANPFARGAGAATVPSDSMQNPTVPTPNGGSSSASPSSSSGGYEEPPVAAASLAESE